MVSGFLHMKKEKVIMSLMTLKYQNWEMKALYLFLSQQESGKAFLTTLGVFLDFDRQMRSFYDAESKVHLYSLFNVVSSNTFFAVFSPGLRDTCPLTVK